MASGNFLVCLGKSCPSWELRTELPKVQDFKVTVSNTDTLVKTGAMVVNHGCIGQRSHIPPNVGEWYAVQPSCVYSVITGAQFTWNHILKSYIKARLQGQGGVNMVRTILEMIGSGTYHRDSLIQKKSSWERQSRIRSTVALTRLSYRRSSGPFPMLPDVSE